MPRRGSSAGARLPGSRGTTATTTAITVPAGPVLIAVLNQASGSVGIDGFGISRSSKFLHK